MSLFLPKSNDPISNVTYLPMYVSIYSEMSYLVTFLSNSRGIVYLEMLTYYLDIYLEMLDVVSFLSNITTCVR